MNVKEINGEGRKREIPVRLNFPSLRIVFPNETKTYIFHSIVASGKIKFRCTTELADGTTKTRFTQKTLLKDATGVYFVVNKKVIRLNDLVAEFLARFKVSKPAKLALTCPRCKTPLKYMWRDNVNAIYDYIQPGTYSGIGDYNIEREFNIEGKGNFEYVYCPNCEFTETNIRKLKNSRKITGEKYIDLEDPVDYYEFKYGGNNE